MLCVAYETLARRGERVALELRNIDFHPNGTGQALIRRGKTDAMGEGKVAYLSHTTVRWLKVWLEHSGVEEGAVFRRLIGRAQIGGVLYSITQAGGGWKSTRMPLQYAEKINAARSGMARAAKESGRDER